MAIPKVFISSTCYDLAQIRDNLYEFMESYYFEPVLSEKGDVFYHPDLHTHESCISEIENCQLFVLIIGGRFGGKYQFDPEKSITNAEYEAARIKNVPVFTFVKREVFEDHRVYQRNKDKPELISQIEFPSIEKQEYSIQIFEFINRVRLASVNNGFFSFEFSKDIKINLGKQWAGMMYNFLSERNKKNNQKIVSQTLDNLTLINKKTEELVESIYKKLSPSEASEDISSFDKVINGAKFFSQLINLFDRSIFSKDINSISNIKPDKKWYKYVTLISNLRIKKPTYDFDFQEDERFPSYKTILLLSDESDRVSWTVESEDNVYPDQINKIMNLYSELEKLSKEERQKAVEIAFINM